MNVLIAGLGSIAQKHISALRIIDESITIYALRSSLNSKQVEGVKDIYALEELKNTKIDFTIISNPTSEHKNTILDVLDYIQCPLFIEKPLYHTLEIDDILDKIQKVDILTYVACNLRFLDCLQYIKNYIENNRDKRLNEVNVYCGSYLPEWRTTDYKKSYSAIPELGGGVHIDLIHEIDYLYWIFGTPHQTDKYLRNVSSLNIEAVDYANYRLDYGSFCANVILNYYRRDYKRTFELVFEDRTILVNLQSNTISSNGEIIFKSNQQIIDTYYSQMKYFIGVLSESKQSFNSIHDSHNVLNICMKMKK